MTTAPSSEAVTWADRLGLADAGSAREALAGALASARRGGTLSIRVSARDDHLARQLVAAARRSAAEAGVALDVSTPDGPWRFGAVGEGDG